MIALILLLAFISTSAFFVVVTGYSFVESARALLIAMAVYSACAAVLYALGMCSVLILGL